MSAWDVSTASAAVVTNGRGARSRGRNHRLVVVAALAGAIVVTAPIEVPIASAIGPRDSDFNGDGYADLAVGAPGEASTNGVRGGGVHVLYGSSTGLRAQGSQLWTQNSAGIDGHADTDDRFGAAVATGDFDNDGYSDLAIGAPWESLDGFQRAGVVHVLYGSPAGLTSVRSQLWSRGNVGVPGGPGTWAGFGTVLAAGDLGRGGADDLAIGVPDATGGDGEVVVLYGGRSGLTTSGAQRWNEATPGVAGEPGNNDHFGHSLAIGDFDGSGVGDLSIGGDQPVVVDGNVQRGAGAVHVLYGTATGLSTAGIQFWTQDSPGIEGSTRPGIGFGDALAAGDLDGDGRADLAIGTPHERRPGTLINGAVYVLDGSPSGLTSAGSTYWTVETPGVEGEGSANDDEMGRALAIGDFGRSGHLDLAIGVPYAVVAGVGHAGAVNVLYGSPDGVTAYLDQRWTQDSPGIADAPESSEVGEEFGDALGAGDFDGDGRADLVVGVHGESLSGPSWSTDGMVHVIRGSVSGLTATGSQLWSQASAGIAGDPADGDDFGDAVG